MRSLFTNMVLDNLIERYDRLVRAERKAHEEWVANRGEEGYLQAWTNAIEELNETDQAINLMQRIIRKEEAHKEAESNKPEYKEVTTIDKVENGQVFIIFMQDPDSQDAGKWGHQEYQMHQKVDRLHDKFYLFRNLSNGNIFPSYLANDTIVHIVKKGAE